MKKVSSLLLLLLTFIWLSCHTDGSNKKINAHTGGTAEIIVPLASTPFFYTQLKGKVAGKDITMQLLKTASNLYRGSYCYDENGQPIALWGTLDAGQVTIYEETNHNGEEQFFNGKLSDNGTFKGVWHGNRTSYHFELHTDLKKAVPLKVFYNMDSVKSMPLLPQSPIGTVSCSIIWPDTMVDATIAAFIKQQITGNYVTNDPKQFLKKEINDFLESYKISFREVDSTASINATTSSLWDWTKDTDIKIVWNTWPILVLEKYIYEYNGGAHGNWGTTYQSLDLSRKKVITTDDIFKPGYKALLSSLLDKAFKEKYQLPETETVEQHLLVKSIPPNDNIIVTSKGIAFSYVPYEIGPYVLGQVTLFLPYSEIKHLMK